MDSYILSRPEDISASQLFKLAERDKRSRVRKRIKAIAYVAEGLLSKEAIARKLHVDKSRIRIWVKQYNERGIEGLDADMKSSDGVSGQTRRRYSEY